MLASTQLKRTALVNDHFRRETLEDGSQEVLLSQDIYASVGTNFFGSTQKLLKAIRLSCPLVEVPELQKLRRSLVQCSA